MSNLITSGARNGSSAKDAGSAPTSSRAIPHSLPRADSTTRQQVRRPPGKRTLGQLQHHTQIPPGRFENGARVPWWWRPERFGFDIHEQHVLPAQSELQRPFECGNAACPIQLGCAAVQLGGGKHGVGRGTRKAWPTRRAPRTRRCCSSIGRRSAGTQAASVRARETGRSHRAQRHRPPLDRATRSCFGDCS